MNRQQIRAHRKSLDAQFILDASTKISEKVIALPAFIQAQKIGYYISHENECDPALIAVTARKLKKELFLPVISADKKNMQFYSHTVSDLYKNHFGIAEINCQKEKPIETKDLDLIIVPIVAFDKNNNRWGRGAGFYDRCLEFKIKNKSKKPILIGLAYEFQKIDLITPEAWDVPMDCVVTEES